MNYRKEFWLLGLLIYGLLVMGLVRPWEVPVNNREKWKRSLLFGIFTALSIPVTIVTAVWSTAGIGGNLSDVIHVSFRLLICLGIPFGLMATLGFYYGYGPLGWMLKKRAQISGKPQKRLDDE